MTKYFILTTFTSLLFSSCETNEPTKEFYGTYSINDSFHVLFSKLIFYHDNIYSYYAHSCLAYNRDSGEYKLVKDTITFRSFNLPLADTSIVKPLTGCKLIYKKDKIFLISRRVFPNKTKQIDSSCWTKQIK